MGDCQKAAQQELLSLKSEPYIVELLNQHTQYSAGVFKSSVDAPRTHEIKFSTPKYVSDKKRVALSEKQVLAIATAPKKVASILNTIWGRGLYQEMKNRFLQGDNPFEPDRHRTLHAIYAEIKQSKRTRAQLVETLQAKFDWAYASAYPEITNMWKVIMYLGFAHEDGAFLVRTLPSNTQDN